MFTLIKQLIFLMTPKQRRQLAQLQLLVVAASFAELIGVASVGPFMALVANPARLQTSENFAWLYTLLNPASPTELVFWMGIGVITALGVGGAVSMLTLWRLAIYAQTVGATLGNRLFRHYLGQPWLFHTTAHSSQFTKQITQEASRVTNAILTPLVLMNAKLVMALVVTLALLAYSPLAACTAAAIVCIAYMLLYGTVRQRLTRNGRSISAMQQDRFRTLSEAFGGIKDVLLLKRQDAFARRYEKANDRLARCQGNNQVLAQVPRYAMESCGFAAIVLLILYLLKSNNGDLSAVLPVLAVYALAGLKILPAVQQVYAGVSQIRGNLSAFEAIRDELKASLPDAIAQENGQRRQTPPDDRLSHQLIALREVTLTYPGKRIPALDRLSLEIPARQLVGLVGSSGAGKSTALDVLLGMLTPQQGCLEIDGKPLTAESLRRWQNGLAYVPQSIFLADASVRENIAFGLPPEQIDPARLHQAVELAHLETLIKELPKGLDTRVGERGLQLSGGQRQRIGIARALYRDADILIFDEATNALDGITEGLIMDAVHDFSGQKTIVLVAHRLSTVKKCDVIYLLAGGRVVDRGRYEELLDRNDTFRRMALVV